MEHAKEVIKVDWKQAIDDYIRHESKLAGALVGLSVRCATTQEKRYERMGDQRLQPASNMKLVTGAAALAVLGEDHRFSTELWTDGTIVASQLVGHLYIRGKGDPTLQYDDFRKMCNDLKGMGITHIQGDIIGDDTWYDKTRLSPDLIWSDEHFYYGAQISALTVSPDADYDAGTVIVEVRPGRQVGDQPIVNLSPQTDYMSICIEATTTCAEIEEDLIIKREHGQHIIVIEGTIPIAAKPSKEWIAVWEPTNYVLDLFRTCLQAEGITWTGTVKSGRLPQQAKRLIVFASQPLSELLIPFMKLSNNGHAEVLLKEMGVKTRGQGSWESGIEAVKEELLGIGIETYSLIIRDGSGISHLNLISPNQMTFLLAQIQNKKWFSTFLHSLPRSGNRERLVGGTLIDRMEGLSVQAKTGTLIGVSTLSGYVDTKNAGRLIFSIMLNHLIDEDAGPDIEDQLVQMIAQQ